MKGNGLVIVNSCSSRFYGCELNDVVLCDVVVCCSIIRRCERNKRLKCFTFVFSFIKRKHQDTHKHHVNFNTRVRARRCSGCFVVVVGLQRWSWQIARYSSQDVMLRTRELGVWARTQAHRQR